jgi:hypothetical protein
VCRASPSVGASSLEGKLRKKSVPQPLYTAGRHFFGSWKSALARAGLDYEDATDLCFWTREKVIEAIQKLAQK